MPIPETPTAGLPHPFIGKDVFYSVVEPEPAADREYEDILLRRVARPVAHRFRGAAGARALTHAQYLAALVSLHEATRQRADAGDIEIAAVLDQLGLRTVSI